MIQVNLIDIFNWTKTYAVHEMAKAEEIMHGAYLGNEADISKVCAQGAYSVAKNLLDGLSVKLQDAMQDKFSFSDDIQSMLKNIEAIDPYHLAKAQQVSQPTAPVEGEALPLEAPVETVAE